MIVMSADMCHPPARTDSGGGGGESQGNPRRGGEYHFFLGRKLCSAFGQPAFFLAGNRLTTMAFGKEVTFGEGLEMFSFSVVKSTFYLAYIPCNPSNQLLDGFINLRAVQAILVSKVGFDAACVLSCVFMTEKLNISRPSLNVTIYHP